MKALGFIETYGWTAAVEAADAAAKAAQVRVYPALETVDAGLVTVKMEGDVAAVQAAVSAGAAAARRVGRVVSTLVIPRPHADLAKLGHGKEPAPAPPPEPPVPAAKAAAKPAGKKAPRPRAPRK